MKLEKVIHILRNPWGWSSVEIREAQIEACNLLEKNTRAEPVSVNEWLPEKSGVYLVYVSVLKEWRTAYYSADEKQFFRVPHYTVTYWLSIPPSPNE